VLTLDDLKNPNESGLYPLLAYEMNGVVLEAEPDGSGPLRLVMPQYSEDEVNKPSWVSNVRLIEVGPLREGYEAPDPAQVPVDEIWLYGDVAATYRYPLFVPLLVLVAGVLFLLAAAALAIKGRGEGGGGKAAAAVLLAAVLACSGLLALAAASTPCSAGPGGRVFSLAELKSMPAFSGHYTFLKSQEPYTYYEDDYTGVPLSYIIEEEMDLLPGASEVVVRARDNYSKTLSLSQIRAVYPGGLKVIIAYERNGVPLTGDESGLRLVVPQTVPGTREQGGDANTPLCVRMVYALEVLPLPAGEQVPAATSVPVGSLAVYGSVSEPAPTPPAPEPQPEPPPADTPAEAEPGAGEEEQAQPEAEPASGEEEPLSLLETLARDPLGAFSLNWLLTASIRMQPALAVLPLAAYLDKEGREP
jgi:DMSO/TMAO reductase YedYZ molybdopterin-dependent catalytic subunit